MEKWPTFFIVGAVKSGTTSLYAYLSKTPGVFMPDVKETRYYLSNFIELQEGRSKDRIRDKTKYLKLFLNAKNEKAIGEATPFYLVDPKSAELIHHDVPNARIIVILRDPIERAFSHYLMRKRNGIEKRSFHELIDMKLKTDPKKFNLILDAGLYCEQVKRFLDVFGYSQVKILFFESFIKNPKKAVKDVLNFLQVDANPPDDIDKIYNPYGEPRGKIAQSILSSKTIRTISRKTPQTLRWRFKQGVLLKETKKPEISEDNRLGLENYYRNNMKNLELLLKLKLPWNWVHKIPKN